MTTFESLGIEEGLLDSLQKIGFETPTPIQEKAIPVLLQGTKDFIGLAQTGTGKTAAFGLPLLQLIDKEQRSPQALIICPTRELCLQITKDIEKFRAKKSSVSVTAVYGGTSISEQIRSLKKGTQIVVATPGRLIDLIERKAINLEDIKAPECFYIEKELKARTKIPIMHDDQHGTAIISAAALLNALEIQKKKIEKARFVVMGAGAASMSCCALYVSLGAKEENFLVFDSKGVIHKNRENLDEHKKRFATELGDWTLESAMKDADVFIGLSKGNVLTKDIVKSMAKNPIVFAMANPDPEISYTDATSARKDVIMATGRSDYPNQVNNVLGFPYIFRGALDVRATMINEEMKLAAVKALAELTKLAVPDIVNMAYNEKNIVFGSYFNLCFM